jgi:hypothetical protein
MVVNILVNKAVLSTYLDYEILELSPKGSIPAFVSPLFGITMQQSKYNFSYFK